MCYLGAFHAPYSRWLWLAVPFLLAILLASMLPPLDFDVREYHQQAPKEFFQQGQITFLPHNVYANMALGTEMFSLLAMVLTGDWWTGALAGKTVIAFFTPLTALGLLVAGRRLFSPTTGVVAALVYLSIPWVVSIASGGLVDGASACYLLLAVYALLLSQPMVRCTHPTSLIALAGYLAGAAVATKYPAVLFVLLPLAAWVFVGNRTAAKRGMIFLLAATVACGLWFGKNWVLTGNPTYPLLYSVFDGRSWDMHKEQQWNQVHRPHDFSMKTLGKDLGRVALTSEWLSPLVIPLAVLAFFGWGRRFPVRWGLLAYIFFVIASWWLLTLRIDRFWIPVLPVIAMLAGIGACWSEERWWRWMLAALLVIGLGANFLVASSGQGNAWFVSLTRLRNDPDWIDPWHKYFNAEIIDGRLLAVGDAAAFDLTVPVLYNTCFDDCIFERLVQGKTPQEVRAAFASHRITYIYVNWSEIDRYRRTYGFTDFVQPEVFDRLVAEGVLEPLPPIEGSSGRGYRVKP
jgi:4-amino-4-deoxy-L-arabinose transferase-like glycosyltransferase